MTVGPQKTEALQDSETPFMAVLRRGSITQNMLQLILLSLIIFLSIFPGCALGWTYHSHRLAMNWTSARSFCRANYTDLLAIQNQVETEHILNITSIIPHQDSTPHYWIGLRKNNGTWTWVGLNRALAGNGSSWAPNEPNNDKDGEDCVQIYIRLKPNGGKWNDAKCSENNRPICYKAQCTRDACYGRGECVEVINSFKCLCYPGFTGPQCQTAIECRQPVVAQNVSIDCCGPHGNVSFGATCTFRCGRGFRREGPAQITCNATSQWSDNEPECLEAPCEHVREPAGGQLWCSGGVCSVRCQPGFLLLGPAHIPCQPPHLWSDLGPVCASPSHLLLVVLGWNILMAACWMAYCCHSHRRRRQKCKKQGSPHDQLNPAYDPSEPLGAPLSPP